MSTRLQYRKNDNYTKVMNDEIENTWCYFMTAFGYEVFYRDGFKNFNSKTNQLTAENKLKKLFETLGIYDEDYNLYSDDVNVLSNAKVWIMYIVLVFNDMTINEIILIFYNSVKCDIDKIFMFEFFLIFMSKTYSVVHGQINVSNRKLLISGIKLGIHKLSQR